MLSWNVLWPSLKLIGKTLLSHGREVLLVVAILIAGWQYHRATTLEDTLQDARSRAAVAEQLVGKLMARADSLEHAADSLAVVKAQADSVWRAKLRKAKDRVIIVDSMPVPGQDTVYVPGDTIPLLEHPTVKSLIEQCDVRVEVRDQEITALRGVIVEQSRTIDLLRTTMPLPPKKPSLLKRVLVGAVAGGAGAWAGQALAGPPGIVVGVSVGIATSSLFR